MLTYSTLQDRPREFLAATSLTHEEFARVLPAFAAAYAVLYPPDKTWEGKVRQRQSGGGAKGGLPQMADKLFFILVYQKTNPLQTMHGLQFSSANPRPTTGFIACSLSSNVPWPLSAWRRSAMPAGLPPVPWRWRAPLIWPSTVRSAVANVPPMPRATGATAARRNPYGQEHPAGQRHTTTVVYLGPTVAGKSTTRKRPMKERLPIRATPRSTRTRAFRAMSLRASSPKTQSPEFEVRKSPQSPHLQCTRGRRKRHCRGETVLDCPRCLAPDEAGMSDLVMEIAVAKISA